jgi:hypothetical protein
MLSLNIKTNKFSEDSMGIGIESTAGVTSSEINKQKREVDSDHSHDFDDCKHSDGENISSPEVTSPNLRNKVNDSNFKNVHLRPTECLNSKKRCSSACRQLMGSPKAVAPDLSTKNLLKMPNLGGAAPAGAGSLAARLRKR